MGQLTIWSSSKADILHEALTPAFSRIDQIPDHKVVPYVEGTPVVPGHGDVCLVMGSKTLKELQAHKMVHGGRAVNGLRQTAIVSKEGGWYLFTLDPFMVRTQADAPSLIRQDVTLACRLALTGSVDPKLGKYRIVEDLSDLVVEIGDRLLDENAYVDLACDTETLGLHPEAEGARIITIQFTLDPGTAEVLFLRNDGSLDDFNRDCLEWLLTHPRILLSGANWKFDSRWIHRHLGILCTNLSKDSLLLGSLIDENRSNSLKTHAWDYTELGGYDRLDELGYDKGRMDLVPPEVLKDYAGADTDVTIQSAAKMKMEVTPKQRRLYQKIVLPAAQGFEAMEHEGVVVDLEKFSALRNDLSVEIETLEQGMLDLMPARLRAKYGEKIKDQLANDKSPLVPSLLRDYFFSPYGLNLKPKIVTPKSQEPSTAKAHLMMFEDEPEAMAFVELLNQNTSAAKTRSTFVDGFLKHLRADGRLHPSYMLFAGSMFGGDDDDDAGTVTGRTSCKEPAFQTIPKKTKWAKRLRECYPAPPGYVIFAADFSQGELKVVACIANEANMITAFKKGLDLHSVTAAAFMGISYDEFRALEQTDPFTHTLMRTGAKAGNFGLLYGMQVEGFQTFARTAYGVKMTLAETTDRRNAFFGMYPGLLTYHETCKNLIRKNKQIESPLGRIRHLPLVDSPDEKSRSEAQRQGINAPVQSTLNDLTLYSLAEMRRTVQGPRWMGMVHDQLLAYLPEDHAEDQSKQCLEVMDNLPIKKEFGWDHQLQFTADGELGPNLAKLVKL